RRPPSRLTISRPPASRPPRRTRSPRKSDRPAPSPSLKSPAGRASLGEGAEMTMQPPIKTERNCRRQAAGAVLAAILLLATPVSAEERDFPSKRVPLRVETLAEGLQHPWSVEVLPDGGYLVS